MAQEAKYQRIVDWVKGAIQSRELITGEKVPSENELSRRFGLSRQTIRHALEILEQDGVIYRVQGSGTYVGDGRVHSRRPRHNNIAVISTYYDYYIFPPTLHGIETVMAKAGYTTRLSFTNDSVHHEKTILNNLLERDDVDGIIVEPAKSALPNPNLPLYQKLRERGIPILFFNADYPELELPCVRLDDVKIAGKATELLIANGHREIGAILNAEDGQGHLRYRGYLQAMWEHHLPADANRILFLNTEMIRNISVIEPYLMDGLSKITGVLCYNDDVAFQLKELLSRHGKRVPEDLSIVSIDDAKIASISGLTSFPHPKEELGRVAAEQMLKWIENPSFDANVRFDSEAVVRDSIASLV